VGKKLNFCGQDIAITELTQDSFKGIDIALFSAGGSVSKEFVPHAVRAGSIVIDNSSAFRQDPEVPLVVPEINAEDMKWHKGIIANPNCTTAITLMALWPLHQSFGVKRIFASSYQAVSGTGAKAIEELERQVGDIVVGVLDGEYTLKRLRKDKGKFYLQAENSAYPDMFAVDELQTAGVVKGVIRRY
jgi:aspartate-semialdehyde dehydrogenase